MTIPIERLNINFLILFVKRVCLCDDLHFYGLSIFGGRYFTGEDILWLSVANIWQRQLNPRPSHPPPPSYPRLVHCCRSSWTQIFGHLFEKLISWNVDALLWKLLLVLIYCGKREGTMCNAVKVRCRDLNPTIALGNHSSFSSWTLFCQIWQYCITVKTKCKNKILWHPYSE